MDLKTTVALVTGGATGIGRAVWSLAALVNCAGITRFIPGHDLESVTDDVWLSVLGVNLLGTFYACRAAAPALRQAGGAIVNVASIAAFRGSSSSLPYGVSKAAVVQLTRGLAVALAPRVRVNAVAPGAVSTRWSVVGMGVEAAEANAERNRAATPLGRVATPEEVAQAILALLSCDFATGQTLVVDGGRTL